MYRSIPHMQTIYIHAKFHNQPFIMTSLLAGSSCAEQYGCTHARTHAHTHARTHARTIIPPRAGVQLVDIPVGPYNNLSRGKEITGRDDSISFFGVCEVCHLHYDELLTEYHSLSDN